MVLSRRVSWFLVAFGVWSWIIWPTFLRNIWKDDRSWDDGPTSFFLVHLVLVVVSLTLGTIIGGLGIRGFRRGDDTRTSAAAETSTTPESSARSSRGVTDSA